MARYSIEFKKKVIAHFKKYGAAATIRDYNVSKRSVYYWSLVKKMIFHFMKN